MQMKDKINNLKAFVGIEPTTREIMLNPPKEPAYIEKNKNMAKLQEKIEADLREILLQKKIKSFGQLQSKMRRNLMKRII